MEKKNIKDIVISASALAVMAGGVTAALAGTNALTKDTIAARNEETENKARLQVIEADDFEKQTLTAEGEEVVYYAAVKGGETVGYVFTASATGKSSGLVVMTGISSEGKITGVTVTDDNETAGALFTRLAALGGEALVQALDQIGAGTAARTPQDHAAATFAPMLSKELSPMDFGRTAWQLHNQVRGLQPWPVAVTELGGIRCKVFSTDVCEDRSDAAPGTVLSAGKDGIRIACGDGSVLRINELQADGGKRMSAADYLRGHPIHVS